MNILKLTKDGQINYEEAIGDPLGVLLRYWIKSGIEDSDGKFEKTDLSSLLIHYSTLWCIRLYV